MVLPITQEQRELKSKYRPYLNEKLQLVEDAPEEAKRALEEFIRIDKERMDFAYSM